ncbi:MAG: hypothetical protein BZY75_00040 [SAR202 cluster bacterium Io17-Chloro-G7]|nr:MAG: hypothetical protein BZY75_00040 [SAR202 cluster bacterium Io17-Chloro-G7]
MNLARILLAHILVVLAFSLALAACSGGSPNVEDLLLGIDDFPRGEVTESNPLSTVTPQGVSAVQVDLSGPDFTLNQSIVMFQTQASALSVLAGIKQDQLTQTVLPADTSRFEDSTEFMFETRGNQEFLTQFFVEGLALVKVTISGPRAPELLPVYAEKARSKVSGQ